MGLHQLTAAFCFSGYFDVKLFFLPIGQPFGKGYYQLRRHVFN
jgi:hypothetical protein